MRGRFERSGAPAVRPGRAGWQSNFQNICRQRERRETWILPWTAGHPHRTRRKFGLPISVSPPSAPFSSPRMSYRYQPSRQPIAADGLDDDGPLYAATPPGTRMPNDRLSRSHGGSRKSSETVNLNHLLNFSLPARNTAGGSSVPRRSRGVRRENGAYLRESACRLASSGLSDERLTAARHRRRIRQLAVSLRHEADGKL